MGKESDWNVPYGNLMTILMIFFLLLYAFTFLTGRVNYERVVASMSAGFGKTTPLKEVALAEYLEDYFSKKQGVLRKLQMDADRIKLIFNIPIFFKKGSSEIKPSAVKILNDICNVVKDIPNNIIIEGYSTDVAGRNEMLISASRALKIGKIFVDKGLDPYRIIIKGWGSSRPLYTGSGLKSRVLNNRVEISIQRSVSLLSQPMSEKLLEMKELHFYADYYYRQGDMEKANEYFEKILKIDPVHWRAKRMIRKIKKQKKVNEKIL